MADPEALEQCIASIATKAQSTCGLGRGALLQVASDGVDGRSGYTSGIQGTNMLPVRGALSRWVSFVIESVSPKNIDFKTVAPASLVQRSEDDYHLEMFVVGLLAGALVLCILIGLKVVFERENSTQISRQVDINPDLRDVDAVAKNSDREDGFVGRAARTRVLAPHVGPLVPADPAANEEWSWHASVPKKLPAGASNSYAQLGPVDISHHGHSSHYGRALLSQAPLWTGAAAAQLPPVEWMHQGKSSTVGLNHRNFRVPMGRILFDKSEVAGNPQAMASMMTKDLRTEPPLRIETVVREASGSNFLVVGEVLKEPQDAIVKVHDMGPGHKLILDVIIAETSGPSQRGMLIETGHWPCAFVNTSGTCVNLHATETCRPHAVIHDPQNENSYPFGIVELLDVESVTGSWFIYRRFIPSCKVPRGSAETSAETLLMVQSLVQTSGSPCAHIFLGLGGRILARVDNPVQASDNTLQGPKRVLYVAEGVDMCLILSLYLAAVKLERD